MKKVILMALATGLFILSGCKKDDSVKSDSSAEKGAVIVSLETEGLASDIITVEISINGQVVQTLDKNNKEYKNIFDIQKETNIKIQPKFASVAAPTETYNFGYTYSYMVGTTPDGGTTWSKDNHDSVTKDTHGASAGHLEGLVNYAKNDMKTVEASFSNGMLDYFNAHN